MNVARPVMLRRCFGGNSGLPADGAGDPDRREVQRPLATVVLGGIVTPTLLTLMVIRAPYRIFEREREIAEGE